MMSDWRQIGSHRYRHHDDVLYFEPHGAITLESAKSWLETVIAHCERHKHPFILVDARDFSPPSGEVRRMAVGTMRRFQHKARPVGFGANLLVRAAVRLILAAARQLYKIETNIWLVATEAEAWAYIDQQRRLLHKFAERVSPPES